MVVAGRQPHVDLPHQTPEILDRDLDTVLGSAANQMSFYPVMITDSVRRKMTVGMGRLDRRCVHDCCSRILERPIVRMDSGRPCDPPALPVSRASA